MGIESMSGMLSTAESLTEQNTKRLGIANVLVFNEGGTVKMRVVYDCGDEKVLDNLSDMQRFIDEALSDLSVIDKIKARQEGVRKRYGNN